MKNINKQRKASLLVLTFAMALAIYLNRQYARGTADNYISVDDTIQQTNARAEMDQSDMLMSSDDYETKNYGDAQLVATTRTDSEKYFEEARLARQKSRDEALDTLQTTLKNAKLTDDEKIEFADHCILFLHRKTNKKDCSFNSYEQNNNFLLPLNPKCQCVNYFSESFCVCFRCFQKHRTRFPYRLSPTRFRSLREFRMFTPRCSTARRLPIRSCPGRRG